MIFGANLANQVRHVSSGIYFARARVKGKLIRKRPKTCLGPNGTARFNAGKSPTAAAVPQGWLNQEPERKRHREIHWPPVQLPLWGLFGLLPTIRS
jgi:hypothetical protein